MQPLPQDAVNFGCLQLFIQPGFEPSLNMKSSSYFFPIEIATSAQLI